MGEDVNEQGTRDERRAAFHSVSAALPQLRPGGALKVGRHPANDVVLRNPTVSRFHVELVWPAGSATPLLRDVSSHNGTVIDGRRVVSGRDEPLRHGTRVVLGTVELVVSLRGVGAESALTVREEADDTIKLCFDCGPNLIGWLGGRQSIWEVLELLERERRTGILELMLPDVKGSLTFGRGRIMYASAGSSEGMAAVERVLRSEPDTYFRFSREFEVREGPPLSLRPSELALRLRRAPAAVQLRAA